jgi:hypothetical protein
MPSIFEKPSILGFRAEGTKRETPTERAGRVLTSPIGSVRPGQLTINPLDQVPTKGFFPWLKENAIAGAAGFGDYINEGILSPLNYMMFGNEPEELRLKERYLKSLGYGIPEAAPTQPEQPTPAAAAPAYGGPMAAVPTGRQTPLPGLGGGAVPTATSEFMNRLLKLPTSADVPSIFDTMTENARQQQPAGTRAERVAAAIASGDFAEKQRQYNQEAMRMGSPTMMDAQGNIVDRELTVPEQMREAFMRTGGNTPFMQTNDPMQRALQNEMMKQARAQATVNTFGTTPEERLANLQAETDARKILQSPLNSGVREVAPGVRAATRDGQTVGFSTPGDGKTAPQGTITDPITGEQMPLALYNEMTRQTQATKGMTGGSPMERGLLAAMQAAEAKRAPAASPVAPGFRATTPSGAFAQNFGYGDAPAASPVAASPVAASPVAPGFRATTPSGAFAQNFGYGDAPAASPVAASPVAASPVAASPVAASPVAASPVAASPVAASPVAAAESMAQFLGASPTASSTAAGDLKAVRDAYAQMFGGPAPAATGAKEPRGPTYFDVPPNATNQRALELAMEEMSIPSVAPAGYSAFSPQSRPTSAFPADVSTPVSAETTGAKGTRKALGGDKTKKAVRGPTYFDVPPNATNQRARK